ncbi:hypothetical protein CDAR_297371 [Caerostris darwini]|uniref:Ig-like domain-containing protein n=1 Tax=Caerostris darwini TaxID=1538125 RepID=A0AAV4PP93_9ARAC|nr:hypothetical protein CDAR_297371 [Caerostris darwini]
MQILLYLEGDVHGFDLRVSRAHIPEGPNLYIQSGSTINLTCIITESTSPPVYVFWYHDDRMINYDSSRGGIRVNTENGPTTVSRLRIQNARPTDSGNYSCQPSYADPANITVHVLNGECSIRCHTEFCFMKYTGRIVHMATNSWRCPDEMHQLHSLTVSRQVGRFSPSRP